MYNINFMESNIRSFYIFLQFKSLEKCSSNIIKQNIILEALNFHKLVLSRMLYVRSLKRLPSVEKLNLQSRDPSSI